MFNLKFKSWIAMIIGLLLLVGCGQTGPLYLPTQTTNEANEHVGYAK